MRFLAVIGLASVLVLALVGLTAPWSFSGWALLLLLGAACAAPWLAPAWRRRSARAALALLALLFVVRVAFAGGEGMTMTTLPGGRSSRWLGRLFDERDVSLLGAQVFVRVRRLPRADRDHVVPALREAYAEMRAELGATPTPFFDTLFGRQSPAGFDALVVQPPRGATPRAAVVFLHGYAGSYAFECWLVARAAAAIDALTVCPSTDFQGHWSDRDGERTARATLAWVHGRGLRAIYLVGLSNGGYGASLLAPRLHGELRGLVLISGAAATAPAAGVPTLVLQGQADTMASPSSARAYAERTGARYASFAGGHFALLTEREAMRATIGDFLRARTVPKPFGFGTAF